MDIIDEHLRAPRPKIDAETGEPTCGNCGAVLSASARHCPGCSVKIFTLRGYAVRRGSAAFGILAIIGSVIQGGLIPFLFGILLLATAGYYYYNRPIYSLRPPHQPVDDATAPSLRSGRSPKP